VSATPPPRPISWPTALVLPPWARGLAWGARLEQATRDPDIAGASLSDTPPILRLSPAPPFGVGGLALAATLVFELDTLVAVILAGPLDKHALNALGASRETADDHGHHRLTLGETRLHIDALDGVLRLEPDDDRA
jgi:hypothetical protein